MDERVRIGWREWVRLPDLVPEDRRGHGRIKAKVDTGARTSAIHAWDIEHLDRAGTPWVRFGLHPRQRDDDFVVTAEAPVIEEREVRSSNGLVQLRIVVGTTLEAGGLRFPIELTLSNRDDMGFRMLLGRTALADRFVVDPGASYLLGRPPRRAR